MKRQLGFLTVQFAHEQIIVFSESDKAKLEDLISRIDAVLEGTNFDFTFKFKDRTKQALDIKAPEEKKTELIPDHLSGINPFKEEKQGLIEVKTTSSQLNTIPDTITVPVSGISANASSKISKTDEKSKKGSAFENTTPKDKKVILPKEIILPNGKVNIVYSHLIPWDSYGYRNFNIMKIQGIEELGLQYDGVTNIISGKPKKHGEYAYKIMVSFDEGKGKINQERTLKIYINPDPKSLWKKLPNDKTDKYYKEDESTSLILTPERTMVAASLRGRSHAHEGIFRDDDFRIVRTKGGWNVLVVADGAGSAKYSRWGSKIACETTMEYLTKIKPLDENTSLEEAVMKFHSDESPENKNAIIQQLWHSMVDSVFEAKKSIKEEADKNGNQTKDYYTTTMLAICKKYDFGYFIAGFGIGDGGIGIYKDQGYVRTLNKPDGGEFAGQTRFITEDNTVWTSEGVVQRIHFEFVSDFKALILMTDGISDPIFETDSNFENVERWNDLWNTLTKDVKMAKENTDIETELLLWLDFWSDGNHDDRTIAILF